MTTDSPASSAFDPEAVVHAPAKLTISLRVTGVRDDGYHLIDAEMVTLDLFDTLEFAPGEGLEIIDERPGTERPGQSNLAVIPADSDNLVNRALRLVGRTARVRLTKRIPAEAGLGGGSADAAAVLRWAGFDDPVAAAKLGADIPFCLIGGRARVRGIGERVDPLEPSARTFTLVTPPIRCPTPDVYAAWDRLGGPSGSGANDLEPAALAVAPELASWRDDLAAASGRRPQLAGSGSTWFVDGAHPGDGRTVVMTT